MKPIFALFVTVLMMIGWASPGRASGDYQCYPSWTLSHTQMSECDNMALLGPGNDTRINLALLIADGNAPLPGDPQKPEPAVFFISDFAQRLYPQPDSDRHILYADGEGSRCLSNDGGAADFEKAVSAAKKLSAEERAALIGARKALQPNCAGSETPGGAAVVAEASGKMGSAPGKAFARYLVGANAFYGGDYDVAAASFTALKSAKEPWLKETGRYMVGRVAVNQAQVGAFDEYGYLKDDRTINPRLIAAVETPLRDYLKAYPRGAYARSARGLIRRAYWLGGDDARLAAEYGALFALPGEARGVDDITLALEVDNKLIPRLTPANVTDPTLIAVTDLRQMRYVDQEYNPDFKAIGRAEIEAQRAHFGGNPALYDYLLAAHAWFVAKQPAEVLRLIPAAAPGGAMSNLEFSRQMLRGMALEANGDAGVRDFWLAMLPGAQRAFQRPAIELAIAMHDERTGGLARVFAPDSQVRTVKLREILLAHAAGPALLRQQAKDASAAAHERQVALFTLLYKGVTRGRYAEFLRDLALVPAGAKNEMNYWDFLDAEELPLGVFTRTDKLGALGCPPLRETAALLAKSPQSARGKLCVADFMRDNGLDQFVLDEKPDAADLGGTQSLFPGPLYSRLEVYKSIIADGSAPAEDMAYALYRAINCYGPSGNNSCGGVEVEPAQRAAWFRRLKKDYPRSPWALKQKIYW